MQELNQKVVELEADKTQLTSLMNSLEQTREQLVGQLQETQRVLLLYTTTTNDFCELKILVIIINQVVLKKVEVLQVEPVYSALEH